MFMPTWSKPATVVAAFAMLAGAPLAGTVPCQQPPPTRFSLVDTVRGQSLSFGRAAVAGSSMTSEVVARDGDVVRLRIRGTIVAKADAAGGRNRWPRKLDTRLLGLARHDLKTGRFLEFDLVALGLRSGGTQLNGRRNHPGPSRIGFLFRLARPGWRVPPAFVNLYDVGWVKGRGR